MSSGFLSTIVPVAGGFAPAICLRSPNKWSPQERLRALLSGRVERNMESERVDDTSGTGGFLAVRRSCQPCWSSGIRIPLPAMVAQFALGGSIDAFPLRYSLTAVTLGSLNECSFGGGPPRLTAQDRGAACVVQIHPGRATQGMKGEPQSPPAGNTNPNSGLVRNPDKYQRILDAAVSVFAEKGFFNSRISDIADRAGVADGTVYLYFKNKDEILMTAINTAFDAFMRHARTELEKLADPAERLRRLAFLHLEALGSNRELAVVFQMELRQSARFLSEFSHHHMIEYLTLARTAISDGQARGIFRRELPDKVVANCFFGALDEMVTSWVLSEHEYRLANMADAVVDVLLKGMQTQA